MKWLFPSRNRKVVSMTKKDRLTGRAAKPRLEALEDRVVPSHLVTTGGERFGSVFLLARGPYSSEALPPRISSVPG